MRTSIFFLGLAIFNFALFILAMFTDNDPVMPNISLWGSIIVSFILHGNGD